MMSHEMNGDLSARVSMHTRDMEWAASPSGTVWRKRLHLVGPLEAGQVTSVVRYEPGSSFPEHDHPEGEEILVLEGVFSDHQGDWPAGTYLLNPEGFRHAPSSEPGCVLLVKLRQYSGEGRAHHAIPVAELEWRPVAPGVEQKLLYSDPNFPDETVIERWRPNTEPVTRKLIDGAEVFILKGSFTESGERFDAGSWLRIPPGGEFSPVTGEGFEAYVKMGGVSHLRSVKTP